MSNMNSLNSIFAAVGSVLAAIETVCGECKIEANHSMYNTKKITKIVFT